MKKLQMLIELEYDDDIMYGGDEAPLEDKTWFLDLLYTPNDLVLVSGELGDEVGVVKVLNIM